jgi:hypothetical protein
MYLFTSAYHNALHSEAENYDGSVGMACHLSCHVNKQILLSL